MSSGAGVEDLAFLPTPVTDEQILTTLRARYLNHQVFTRLGGNAMVFVNSPKALESFSDVASQTYAAHAKEVRADKQPLPAHIFDLAASVYFHMLNLQMDQSLILCGDTGAGKSEARKLFVRQLCALSKTKKKSKVLSGVVKSDILLESFGHARTANNPNSSRFGRYIEFQFDTDGKMVGMKVLPYLLEKARVTHVPKEERSFHVFYQLLAGATEEERLQLQLAEPSQFAYLSSTKYSRIYPDDAIKFNELKDNMKSVGIGRRQQTQIFQLLAAILHLGNIQFGDDPDRPQEPCVVKNPQILQFVAVLLGVTPENLEYCLTYKTKLVKNELCTVFLNAAGAQEQRDGLARTLYSLAFEWIIEHINTRLCKDNCANFIGIVDLPGFQNYKTNSLEQFLYNFANEELYSLVNRRLLNEPIQEFISDSLIAQKVDVFDNEHILDMIADLDNGMIALIDDEAVKASSRKGDSRIAEKISDTHYENAHFVTGKKPSVSFGIRHFAGTVEYDTRGFIEKNSSSVSTDFINIFRGNDADIPESANPFVAALFSSRSIQTESHAKNSRVVISGNQSNVPVRRPSIKASKSKTPSSASSVSLGFQVSVNEMIDTVRDTFPWVVYCLRFSDDSQERLDPGAILRQVSNHNIRQIASARNSADYTVSMTFKDFIARYQPLLTPLKLSTSTAPRDAVAAFVKASHWTDGELNLGRAKAHISEASWRYLEDELRVIQERLKLSRDAHYDRGVEGLSPSPSEDSFGSRMDLLGNVPNLRDDESAYSSEDERSHYSFGFSGQNGRRVVSGQGRLGRPLSEASAADYGSEYGGTTKGRPRATAAKDIELQPIRDDKKAQPVPEPKKQLTSARKKWLCCTWFLTWWIPSWFLSCCGKMKRKDVQIAWREKVALCVIVGFMCSVLLFFIIGFGRLICPKQYVWSKFEMAAMNSLTDVWVYGYGRVYQVNDIVKNHQSSYGVQTYNWASWAGSDVSPLFYPQNVWSMYCPSFPQPAGWDPIANRPNPNALVNYPHKAIDTSGLTGSGKPMQKLYLEYMNQYAKGRLAWTMDYVASQASQQTRLIVIYNNVYDVSTYYNAPNQFLGSDVGAIFGSVGKDASSLWDAYAKSSPTAAANALSCMNHLFYIGTVDYRNSLRCQMSNVILLTVSVILVSVIGFKFLAALQFIGNKTPEDQDKFVILQVPCYTEGAESIAKTLESLALLKYDDRRKLLFVICDGMITGSGNDRPTPRIVLDILGVDPDVDPEALSFQSLGEGDKQHNMGKVYSGLYEIQGRSIPFVVIVKVGKPSERNRPGNRGKRDSQMTLMRFLSRVHFNAEMSPLELELFHHIKNIIGVNPSFYEYILMVDADTEVYPQSLNRMIAAMIHDSRIMGLCGETLLSNEKDSWITMIQVYEYFISHHLSKSFESLFGSVTCLPGCFCMYRIRTPGKNVPLLISPAIINDYSENVVDTLHLKNLLHLGEDRYLTTLMMKHFPNLKLSFVPDAQCRTNAPDRWSVLLSQRRRWINSTVHNLLELMLLPQLCGFCCFSMRFIVFLDLFSTVVQPAAVVYIGYLIYSVVTSTDVFPLMSIIMLGAIYGFQVIIFILKRQWAQIGWMIVYIIATPVFAFYIPLYAFWHFDDFSWGNTRIVVGDDGNKVVYSADVAPFDPKSVPLRKWSDFEAEMWDKIEKDSRADDFADNRSQRSFGSQHYPPVAASVAPSGYSGGIPAMPAMPAMPVMAGAPNGSVYGGYGGSPMMVAGGSQYGRSPAMAPNGSQYAASAYGDAAGGLAPMQAAYGYPAGRNSYGAYGGAGAFVPGTMPSDEMILVEARKLLASANLMSITKKQVRDELSTIFGVDLTPKKTTINAFIEDILQGKL
ncbi:chitin synthase-domain-containing protein [Polychytrium aggregatum]|uniref:chitin synthase-domain-containing protein n=1 Tax=Polychytrium aggregatum TaxID=110093 RepID=UPI0022FE1AEE|nr:chitin synthase-domain-containing protein [Polychytrium aggregatum]KAI9208155.1 chitin synthase-domain-containing protein [Polychytrium aggregatum]